MYSSKPLANELVFSFHLTFTTLKTVVLLVRLSLRFTRINWSDYPPRAVGNRILLNLIYLHIDSCGKWMSTLGEHWLARLPHVICTHLNNHRVTKLWTVRVSHFIILWITDEYEETEEMNMNIIITQVEWNTGLSSQMVLVGDRFVLNW